MVLSDPNSKDLHFGSSTASTLSSARIRASQNPPSLCLFDLIGDARCPYNAACWLLGAIFDAIKVNANIIECG
jgi:hypothetical protein